jgi:hypothetical protein
MRHVRQDLEAARKQDIARIEKLKDKYVYRGVEVSPAEERERESCA